jgi:hypothetical protein
MEGSANKERAKGNPWSLMAVSTGNTSIINIVSGMGGKSSPQAEAQRVLEVYIDRQFVGSDAKAITDNFNRAIRKNYGHAGPMFIQYIIDNPERTKEIIEQCRAAVDMRGELSSENRFWSAQITYALAALKIAKLAGIFSCDLKHVFSYVIGTIVAKNRDRVSEMYRNAEETVSEFLADNWGKLLVVTSDVARLGDNLPVPPAERSASIAISARYESDTGYLFIRSAAFSEWCSAKQIDTGEIVSSLKKTHNAEHQRKRLGTGTSLALNAVATLRIDWNKELHASGEKNT